MNVQPDKIKLKRTGYTLQSINHNLSLNVSFGVHKLFLPKLAPIVKYFGSGLTEGMELFLRQVKGDVFGVLQFDFR